LDVGVKNYLLRVILEILLKCSVFITALIIVSSFNKGAWGSVVVKALRCKSEGPGIDSRCRRGFSRDI
jgi:hypothetical protein